jgi:hypothetical protein
VSHIGDVIEEHRKWLSKRILDGIVLLEGMAPPLKRNAPSPMLQLRNDDDLNPPPTAAGRGKELKKLTMTTLAVAWRGTSGSGSWGGGGSGQTRTAGMVGGGG